MRSFKILSAFVVVSFFHCYVPPPQPPPVNPVNIVISPRFKLKGDKRVAVMPFTNDGKEGYDFNVTDKFSMHLMEIGFTVIERTQLQSILDELKLNYSGLTKNDFNKLGKLLNIDMIVFGSVKYAWIPGRYVNAGEYGSKAVDGHFVYESESARFVDIDSGEILIFAFCPTIENKSMSQEISIGIKEKIREKLIESYKGNPIE